MRFYPEKYVPLPFLVKDLGKRQKLVGLYLLLAKSNHVYQICMYNGLQKSIITEVVGPSFFGVDSPNKNIGEPSEANALSPGNIYLQAKVGHIVTQAFLSSRIIPC